MIDGRLSEFLDLLYMGEELVFEYHNVKYFLQGWSSEGQARMVRENYERMRRCFSQSKYLGRKKVFADRGRNSLV